jgi:hypothetical protein
MNGFFGGLAQGQQYREQQDIRDAENTRRQQEFDQMSRMRDYQMNEMQREKDLNDKLAGISEYEPQAPDALPDAPKVSRQRRDVTFDRANVLSQFGGPKYLGMAQQLMSGQYDLDKKDVESIVGRARMMPGTEADRLGYLSTELSKTGALPGKMTVTADPEGKGFIVSSVNARGESINPYKVSGFDQLSENVLGALSFDNYLKAQNNSRAAAAETRAQELQDPTLRAAKAGATVAERTVDSRIKKAGLENDETLAKTGYYNKMGDAALTRAANSGAGRGGAGGAGRTKDIKVKVYDSNNNPMNLQVRVGVDREGNQTLTTLDGKPITDEKILNQINGTMDFEAGVERDAALRLERLSKSDISDADFVASRDRILTEAKDKMVAFDFRQSPPQAQDDTLNRLIAANAPRSAFAGLGVSEKDENAARIAYRDRQRAEAKKPAQAIPTAPAGTDGSSVNSAVRRMLGRPEPTDPSKPRTGAF